MPTLPLDRSRIQELYAAFQPTHPEWLKWLDDYARDLERFQDIDLHDTAVQTALWSARGLGKAGVSEHLDISPLIGDPTFLGHLKTLSFQPLDTMPSRRAQELQASHDQLLAVVKSRLERTPKVRLQRLMHALKPGDFACTWNQKSLLAVRDLLIAERGLGVIENHVRIRSRLRDALGKESDLNEHARRSIFCWWLHENAEAIANGETPPSPSAEQSEPEVVTTPETEIAPRIEIWPLSRQIRTMEVYRGGVDTLCLVLRECLQPQTLDLLIVTLDEELRLSSRSDRYLTTLLRELRRLGFIQKSGDDYLTTNDGEAFLDDPESERLGEVLCTRIRGLAWLLTQLPQTGADIEASVRANHFGSGSMPNVIRQRHLWWMKTSGLITRDGDKIWQRTPMGDSIHDRLPKPLSMPVAHEDAEMDIEVDDDTTVILPATNAEIPSFTAIWGRFQVLAATDGLVFAQSQVRALFAAWRMGERTASADKPAKRFALLSGLSGTGKTQLLLQYARAVCAEMGLDEKTHIALVPVRPDWRDPTGLLGYLNALHAEPTFQIEPTLSLLLRASRNPTLPYFLLLDEMNLARVERYFAPFLSAMETGKAIDLHAHDRSVSGVPPKVSWPGSLRIGGTVNMDESTHAFSDKVLDRAFTFEFWTVDLPTFFAGRPSRTSADEPVEAALLAFQRLLEPVRRHVGYRTAGEVLDWVATAHTPGEPPHDCIDQALFAKVLPRLRGVDSSALSTALSDLQKLSEAQGYTRCAHKLGSMRQRLQDTGVTGFWA